ncbi:hypothetical protein HDV06_007076 [Boothiomyces sp. JEL0866]|nr:hypothetical protein HDV06_007076 [Boothiomyces sp. JEL0866]
MSTLLKASEELKNTSETGELPTPRLYLCWLSAKVSACRAREERAQQTLQQALAVENRGNSVGLIAEQRITLHEYLQTIPPFPTYCSTLPGPTSTIDSTLGNI